MALAREKAEARVVWEPQTGSQAIALMCPIFECLYEGTRGPGKTDWLLMDYAQDVGKGYDDGWRGILFRQTYKQLDDIISRSARWFKRIFPRARFLSANDKLKWVWPSGEELLFRHIDHPRDYWNYHGHEYPWIGFEELTNWPDLQCYTLMHSCCRTSRQGVPTRIRANANPWGVGHNAVKARFIDPAPPGVVVEDRETGLRRVRVRGHWSENKALLRGTPDYPARIAATAQSDAQRKAWLDGSWDIMAGGRFDGLWDIHKHLITPWLKPDGTLDIPSSWRIDRSYDAGESKPFSIGWWAESDGTRAPNGEIYPPRTLVRIAEWYGWDGRTPNVGLRMTDAEIARGIVEREKELGVHARVKPGPADSQIFQMDTEGKSSAATMAKYGVRWTEADKSPGSRVTGWRLCAERLNAVLKCDSEEPWLLAFDTCRDGYARTFPSLPRDEKKPDDVDTNAEDHTGDETRYRVAAPRTGATVGSFEV